jgi:hypothetical protein
MFIPELINQTNSIQLLEGSKEGPCAICMKQTTKGNAIKNIISSNFTSFEFLHRGTCICELCSAILKDPRFRRSNWIVTSKEIFFLKHQEFINKFEELVFIKQDIPFAAYVTKTFKKHGWLYNFQFINTSIDQFYILYEDEKCFFTKFLFVHIKALIESLIPASGKKSLENFTLNNYQYQTLVDNNLLPLFHEAKQYKNNPGWKLLVNLIPISKTKLKPKKI